MKEIILYFSRSGNNYVGGRIQYLPVGNTEVVAKILHGLTGAELFKIEPVTPYAEDYSKCIEQAKGDLQRQERPELKAYPQDLWEYDTVYLGYPNYWGTMPVVVFSMLERYDWKGKTIRPFCTHEGSGLGRSVADIKRICTGANVKDGLAILGAAAADAEEKLKNWMGERKDGETTERISHGRKK